MATFNSMESGWLEPDDPPELPDGWWDEDTVKDVQAAIQALDAYAQGDPGLWSDIRIWDEMERFEAHLTLLKYAANLLPADDPAVAAARALLEPTPPPLEPPAPA